MNIVIAAQALGPKSIFNKSTVAQYLSSEFPHPIPIFTCKKDEAIDYLRRLVEAISKNGFEGATIREVASDCPFTRLVELRWESGTREGRMIDIAIDRLLNEASYIPISQALEVLQGVHDGNALL